MLSQKPENQQYDLTYRRKKRKFIMKPNKKLFYALTFLGIFILVYFIWNNYNGSSELKEINISNKLDLKVDNAYNERGIYILNNEYFINSYTLITSENYKNLTKDEAIWRPKNEKYIPRISDISAPFRMLKEKNSNILKLLKENDTIYLKIEK